MQQKRQSDKTATPHPGAQKKRCCANRRQRPGVQDTNTHIFPPIGKNDKRLKGLKNVDYYKEGGLYKYTYGASSDYNKVLRTKRSITAQFKDAFIIAFKNGKKVNVNAAINEFKIKRNK